MCVCVDWFCFFFFPFLFETSFPHNYQHPLMFALTFLFNCDSIHMSIFISGSVDTCFSELATSVTIHFQLIQRQFQAVDFAARTAEDELEVVVAYHKDVLQLCLAMTNLFQYTVFYLLLLDSVLLCVIGYQFVIFMNTPRVLMLASMAFVMILQAVIYCYHGSMMYDEVLWLGGRFNKEKWPRLAVSFFFVFIPRFTELEGGGRDLPEQLVRGSTGGTEAAAIMYHASPEAYRHQRWLHKGHPAHTEEGVAGALIRLLRVVACNDMQISLQILNSTGSYITMLLSLETEQ